MATGIGDQSTDPRARRVHAELSDAELHLLERGYGYTYEKDSSGEWLKVGKVRIHRNDKKVHLYSPTILEEDPSSFVPSNEEDGIVRKWGIKDILEEGDDGENMEMMMKTNSMLWGNINCTVGLLDIEYSNIGTPNLQFMKVLEERKLNSILDPSVEAALGSAYVLRIELDENEKDVWRRIVVPATINLAVLHDQVLVPVMGWSRGYHGYLFEDPKDGAVIGPSKYDAYIDMMWVPMRYLYIMDDRNVPLATILREEGDFIHYTYDLGDDWLHRITLEKVIDEPNDLSIALLDGAGACPPEDSNGLEGMGRAAYATLLQAYKKNPKKLKMKEAVREVERTAQNYSKPWLGRPIRFKPLRFDIEYHRLFLGAVLAGPSVKKKNTIENRSSVPVPGTKFKESMRGCTACGDRFKALSNCSRCGKVSYCSKECQLLDWKEGGHKKVCKKRPS